MEQICIICVNFSNTKVTRRCQSVKFDTYYILKSQRAEIEKNIVALVEIAFFVSHFIFSSNAFNRGFTNLCNLLHKLFN